MIFWFFFFFSSRRRHTRSLCDWSSDVCSSDLEVVRMAGQAPTTLTRCLMCELKAEGEEESAHAFHKGLAVAKQLNVGRFVSKIDRDGAVCAGLLGCCAHVSPPG